MIVVRPLCLSLVLAFAWGAAHAGDRDRTQVTCESKNFSRRSCEMDTRGGVRLVEQTSDTRCRQGSNWGWDRGGVWVDRGCAARFESARGDGGRPGNGGRDRDGGAPSWMVGEYRSVAATRDASSLRIDRDGRVRLESRGGRQEGRIRDGRIVMSGGAQYSVDQDREGLQLSPIGGGDKIVFLRR